MAVVDFRSERLRRTVTKSGAQIEIPAPLSELSAYDYEIPSPIVWKEPQISLLYFAALVCLVLGMLWGAASIFDFFEEGARDTWMQFPALVFGFLGIVLLSTHWIRELIDPQG